MFRKVVNVLIWAPIAMIFIVFAVANRHLVTISLDPFSPSDPSVAFTLPLFIVIILVAILGVIAGGVTTWFRQRSWRRAARMYEADAREARLQLADLKGARVASPRTVPDTVSALAHGSRDS